MHALTPPTPSQMVYGHTPFSHLAMIQKLQAIVNPRHRIDFPPIRNAALLDTITSTLQRDARARPPHRPRTRAPSLAPLFSPP